MPDFSGYQQSARAFGQIADLAFSIGTDDRKRQFNRAILQAEADGKTAGVQYDENNNLVPLTNLDYAKATEQLAQGERDAVLNAYKKSAISTYAFAHGNDAANQAQRAFDENSSDPDKIANIYNGKMDALKALDPEIFAAIAPKVDAHFKTAINKAQANLRIQEIDRAVATNTEAFNNNVKEMSILATKFNPNASEEDNQVNDGIVKRLEELEDENDRIFENLRANDVPETKLDELVDFKEGSILTRTYQSHIERVFTATDSEYRTYGEVKKIVDEVLADPNANIDPNTLSTVLYGTAERLRQLKTLRVGEENDLRNQVYHDLYARVKQNKENLADIIREPGNNFNMLTGTQQATIAGMSEEEVNRRNKQFYNEQMAVVKNPELFSGPDGVGQIENAHNSIVMAYANGDIDKVQLYDFMAEYNKSLDFGLSKLGEDASVDIEYKLSDPQFSTPPEFFFRNLDKLESMKAIGENKFAASKTSAMKRFRAYQEGYTKYHGRMEDVHTAVNALSAGSILTSDQVNALEKITPTKIEVNGIRYPLDLNSEDEAIRQGSLEATLNWATTYNYYLPEYAMNAINRPMASEQNLNTYREVVGELALRKAKEEDISVEQAKLDIELRNGLNDSARIFVRQYAPFADFDKAREAFVNAQEGNIDRILSAHLGSKYPNLTNNRDKADQFVTDVIGRTLSYARTPFEKFTEGGRLSRQRQSQLERIAKDNGISIAMLRNMMISDPDVMEAVKSQFFNIFKHTHNFTGGEQAENDAMLETFQVIGKRFGFEATSDGTGIRFVRTPVLAAFQATIPLRTDMTAVERGLNKFGYGPDIDESGSIINPDDPVVTANQRMVEVVWRDSWLARNQGLVNTTEYQEVTEIGDPVFLGLEAGGRQIAGSRLSFHANDNFGSTNQQTYQVVMTNAQGQSRVMEQAWKPTWTQSKAQSALMKVQNEMRTSRIKKLANVGGFFTGAILQGAFENRMEAESDFVFKRLFEAGQEIYFFTGLGSGDDLDLEQNPLTPEEVVDLRTWLSTINSLGVF